AVSQHVSSEAPPVTRHSLWAYQIQQGAVRRVASRSAELERYIAGMSAVRGKPQLVEIDEDLLKAVKAEANRRGMTYRAFFEAALARELKASRKVKTPEQLQLAS
ncbi:MAG TPA: hypothetical protein VHB77_19600, partial [Planctomycetaceae bacterium]|nr:hypothetical protein [Planctomycetaceae bacterium]